MDTLTRIEPALEESLTANPSLTAAQVQGQQVAAELEEELEAFQSQPRRVLTAEGAPWGAIKPELRQLLALVEGHRATDEAQLLVSAQHLRDPFVMAFMGELDRADLDYRVIPSTLSEIQALYQVNTTRGGATVTVDSTSRQQEVIRLLGEAHRRGASDVHFVVGREITRIRFRIHGLLTEHAQIQSHVGRELCFSLYNTMCDVAEEHYQPEISQDARVKHTFVAQLGLYGARVATRPLVGGPLMVLRLLSDDEGKQSLEELGFLPEQAALFARLRALPYGVNLITGPTGSGKSKTLQVTLNQIEEETGGTRHILTVEDPIRANQSPLGHNESWDQAISNQLRLDPDIMMPGEVRDLLSALAAMRGGMTGHQLWSTLHTNNAVASLQRLIDMGVDPSLVTDPALVTGIINQSLLPVLCPHCSVPLASQRGQLSQALLERLDLVMDTAQVRLKGAGCEHCRDLGVTRRTVAAEVLLPTHRFMRIFREKGAGEARSHWVNQMGGITKIQHAIRKVAAGLIDPRMAETIVGPLDFDLFVLEQPDAQ
ncbi:GspE/PulE family protein [Pseudomonas oryzihabitans]|uniref:GspE/PulE family protein n=1 Tax=Pseudomonas oryzihabitans TaxID=47885 RepID=UPI002865C046|nr:ATPase, T2SS/T4P/T4SS family [Pseudomonas psychrotolerans]MDR6680234.1 type II secretory ATPase GspE/PulE/Tfp pilus assembly ATPase PilB-like protein [Pseudomonas psychrotolerans]